MELLSRPNGLEVTIMDLNGRIVLGDGGVVVVIESSGFSVVVVVVVVEADE